MAVAKSYEKMEIVGEPFERDGKMYVRVSGPCKRCGGTGNYSYNPKDGTTCFRCGGHGKENMEVRWYTDKQRAAMDRAAEKRAEAKAAKVEERRIKFSARNAFGFDKGYVTLFKGDADVINSWAHETSPCRVRYNTLFGWFCPSWLEFSDLPDTITPIQLTWDSVKNPDDAEGLSMVSDEEVKKIIHELLGDVNTSEYQGQIDEWLEKTVTIIKNIPVDNRYGSSHMHIMHDENENEYVWATASKDIAANTTCVMRMKVKDHKEYNGVKQTIVYYCKVKG